MSLTEGLQVRKALREKACFEVKDKDRLPERMVAPTVGYQTGRRVGPKPKQRRTFESTGALKTF